MRNISILCFLFLLPQNICAQPRQLLENAWINDVQYDSQKNLLCLGGVFLGSVPIVAQKLSADLEYLWPGAKYGVWLTHPLVDDETGNNLMLQQSDGSIVFSIEYNKFMGVFASTDSTNPFLQILYYSYPIIQKTTANGEILWGENGIQLSNHNILCDISAGIRLLNLSFDTAGNVVVIWTYTFAENADRTEEFKGTFMQKIDPVSGELLYDSTGVKLIDENTQLAFEGNSNNIYFFKLYGSLEVGPQVLNIDKNGNTLWAFDLREEFGENLTLGSCDLMRNATYYGLVEREVTSSKKISEIKEKYLNGYEGLKEELRVPTVFEFAVFSDDVSGFDMRRAVPDAEEVVAKDYLMEILNEDGTITNAMVSFQMWR